MKNVILIVFVMVVVGLSSVAMSADKYTGQLIQEEYFSVESPTYDDSDYLIDMETITVATRMDSTVNWQTGTMDIDFFSFSISGGSATLEKDFTVGPGQFKTITTRLDFGFLSGSYSDMGSMVLTPGTGGDYEYDTRNFPLGDLWFSGTFEITGPTQSSTGEFSYRMISTSMGLGRGTVDTVDYPDELRLTGSWTLRLNGERYLIDEVVDGINIQVFLPDIRASSSGIRMFLVPEPATLTLLTLGGLALVRRRRRK